MTLSEKTAGLIARLPDDFGGLTVPLIQELREVRAEVTDAMTCAARDANAVLDTAQLRGYPPDTRLADALTEVEKALYLDSQRRYMDAERALDALDGWKERSGAERYGFRRPERHEPLVTEDTDGGLLIAVPTTPEEDER